MSRWICIDDICIPSDENEWEELVAFADAIAEQEPIEIIRCRECKHWCNGDDVHGICYRCPNTRQMRYDDFCSYGCRDSEKPNNSTISKMERVQKGETK